MGEYILISVFFIIGVLIIVSLIYINKKSIKKELEGLEKKLGIKFKAGIEGYKSYYKNHEITATVLSGSKNKEITLRIKNNLNIPFIITNFHPLYVIVGNLKLLYREIKLPIKKGNYIILAKDESEAKKALYSHQDKLLKIEELNNLIELSKGKFMITNKGIELKFPDINLITKTIIDTSISIIESIKK